MHFHQQRRRRLWSDDTSATASAEGVLRTLPTSAKRTSGPAETYTSQARRDEQPRLTDLIPTRYRTLLLIYVAGLLVSTALELLYYHIDALSAHVVREALGVFDLASRGSFAAWYSSLLLSITAITAALIFTLRRHRIDDYRGRYRVWIWGTLGYLAMAVNQTADLDDLLREVVEQAATRLSVFQPWIWPALCFAVWLVCVARFSFELHPSRGALVLGWLGAIGWLLSSTGVGFPKLENPASLVMLAVGLKLLGQLTILAAHVAYARYVLLDAHGLLPARRKTDASQPQRRRKRADKAGDDTEAAKPASPARTDLDPPVILAQQPAAATPSKSDSTGGAKPVFSKPVAPAGKVTDDEDEDEDADSPANQGLTRAERKRLRRERKLERRSAA